MADHRAVPHDAGGDGLIVTAHSPNYLPGASVIEKIDTADFVVWLTEVQYERGGFTNRQRMRDGSWLTVPVDHSTLGGPIGDVRIGVRPWRRKHAMTLRQHYGEAAELFVEILQQPWRYLADLNLTLLALLTDRDRWFFQRDLDVQDDAPASKRLARIVQAVGGTTYLSGSSGRQYLDERPFLERGIEVVYREPLVENPCCLERLAVPC